MIRFSVPGVPVAKGRPRATTINGKVRMYTPAKTQSYESFVATLARQRMGAISPLEGAISVNVYAYWPTPASWSNTRLLAHYARPEYVVKRPDGDNVLKNILDSMNGIVYRDDAQVARATITKLYAELAHVVIEIEKL